MNKISHNTAKYVLGGGIAGLIWAYYNKDFVIVTDKIGGQMASDFDLGPRYLHYTANSKCFLESLNFPIQEKIIKVGYLDDSGWTEPDINFTQNYFKKSRRQKDLYGFDSTTMNESKREFKALIVDCNELIERLKDKLKSRIFLENIRKIDLGEKRFLTDNFIFNYEQIVSTIPLNIFLKLSGIEELDLKSYDMTYWLVDESFFDMKNFDFVYDSRKTTVYHRITKIKKGIVLDFFGKNPEEKIIKYKKEVVAKNSQIISINYIPKFKDVILVGRYGRWTRSWKTEKVIDAALSFSLKAN